MKLALIAMLVLASPVLADDFFDRKDQTRSYYDHNGSFAGTTNRHGNDNTTSAYDRSGSFAGSSIRNSDGTTSFYDRSGHFTGSSVDTYPQRRR